MAVTVTQLATFLAVAREGSVSAAAEQLFVTQPSISAAVSALSRELGVDLTERSGRGVALTPAGDASLRRIRVVAVETAAEVIVPDLLRRFHDLHPDIELQLEVANRDAVFARVLEHEADVAVAGRPPADPRIVGRPFAPNALVLIATPDDELVGGTVVPGRLAERTWLLREPGSGTRQLTTEFIAQHGLEPRTLTLGSNAAIVKSVALGLGVSIQSREAVASELASGEVAEVNVRGGLPERSWHVLNAAGAPIRRPVQLFLEFVLG